MKKEIYEVSKWQQIEELTAENLVSQKRLGHLLLRENERFLTNRSV